MDLLRILGLDPAPDGEKSESPVDVGGTDLLPRLSGSNRSLRIFAVEERIRVWLQIFLFFFLPESCKFSFLFGGDWRRKGEGSLFLVFPRNVF